MRWWWWWLPIFDMHRSSWWCVFTRLVVVCVGLVLSFKKKIIIWNLSTRGPTEFPVFFGQTKTVSRKGGPVIMSSLRIVRDPISNDLLWSIDLLYNLSATRRPCQYICLTKKYFGTLRLLSLTQKKPLFVICAKRSSSSWNRWVWSCRQIYSLVQ